MNTKEAAQTVTSNGFTKMDDATTLGTAPRTKEKKGATEAAQSKVQRQRLAETKETKKPKESGSGLQPFGPVNPILQEFDTSAFVIVC